MKQVVMTVDRRPYQANHTYALPDELADQLVAEGAAAAAPGGDVRLASDRLVLSRQAPARLDRRMMRGV